MTKVSWMYLTYAFAIVAVLVAGFLHIISMEIVTSMFQVIVGGLLGIFIPTPESTNKSGGIDAKP